jgi:gamma-glutamyltranspeptidase
MGMVNVIWQGDANSITLRSLGLCSSPPRVLNMTGPETLSVRALAHRFGAILGREPVIEGAEAPNALLSDAYIHARSAEVSRRARRVVEPGERSLLGVTHDLARSLPGYGAGGNTTHLSTMDRAGNAVSLTQTIKTFF